MDWFLYDRNLRHEKLTFLEDNKRVMSGYEPSDWKNTSFEMVSISRIIKTKVLGKMTIILSIIIRKFDNVAIFRHAFL